jgi:arylsulfatase A-like enzyme
MRENIVNVYDGDVEFLDHWFGYFIKELKRMGIYRRSLIIFLSDHGEEFFDHGGWDHGHTLYNELIRVALIIKFPEEVFKGKRIAANVSLKDVFPTLLEYLEIEPTERVDGKSFMDVIRGDVTSNDRGIISVLKRRQARYTPEKVAIIKKNYKLIYNHGYSEELLGYFGENPPPAYTEYELYDIEKDFAEKNNLIEDKKYFNTFRSMKKDIQVILKLIKQREKGDFEKVKISEKEMERLKSLGYL